MNTGSKTDPVSVPHPTLTDYYADSAQRRSFVSRLFDDTADHYEWIIRLMSFGSGEWYRRQALRRATLAEGAKVLDVATGTGPVARSIREIVGDRGLVIGLDRSFNMMKQSRMRGHQQLVQAAAEGLPFADDQFEFLSMGYALRHVDDLVAAFREYRRVLVPGGKVLILEMTRPQSRLGLLALRFYMRTIVPLVAFVGSGSRRASLLMKYFWDTIEYCVPPEKIVAALEEAGFTNAKRHRVFGIFSEYTASNGSASQS